MPKDPARAPAIRTGIRFHPATRAWRRAGGDRDPSEIRILKERRDRHQVYWLAGAGPGGGSIIAKREARRRAEFEHQIYTEVLPDLPVPSLGYHGSLDAGEGFCWTFLEFACGERYSPAREDHRRLAGEWLGLVHAAAVGLPRVEELGDRGPDHSLSSLLRARKAVFSQLESSAASRDAAVLVDIIRALDALEKRWDDVRAVCDTQPTTLVHGDLAPRNLRVRAGRHGARLEVFDWDASGRGPPAVDLAHSADRMMRFAANPSLDAYRRGFSARGPAPKIQVLKRLAAVGTAIRSVSAIEWETLRSDAGCRTDDKLLGLYVDRMRAGMREAGWDHRHADLVKAGP